MLRIKTNQERKPSLERDVCLDYDPLFSLVNYYGWLYFSSIIKSFQLGTFLSFPKVSASLSISANGSAPEAIIKIIGVYVLE